LALRKKYGNATATASNIREENELLKGCGLYVRMEVMNKEMLNAPSSS
jgi:hypothetical protein